MEGDSIKGVHFIMSGKASFVFPIYDNTAYVTLSTGDHYLQDDIVGSCNLLNLPKEDWYAHKDLLSCQFTTQVKEDCEI